MVAVSLLRVTPSAPVLLLYCGQVLSSAAALKLWIRFAQAVLHEGSQVGLQVLTLRLPTWRNWSAK